MHARCAELARLPLASHRGNRLRTVIAASAVRMFRDGQRLQKSAKYSDFLQEPNEKLSRICFIFLRIDKLAIFIND